MIRVIRNHHILETQVRRNLLHNSLCLPRSNSSSFLRFILINRQIHKGNPTPTKDFIKKQDGLLKKLDSKRKIIDNKKFNDKTTEILTCENFNNKLGSIRKEISKKNFDKSLKKKDVTNTDFKKINNSGFKKEKINEKSKVNEKENTNGKAPVMDKFKLVSEITSNLDKYRSTKSFFRDPNVPEWKKQQVALKKKFGEEGWKPQKKLSREEMSSIKLLKQENQHLTTSQLGQYFKVSPEAVRRILKSRWVPKKEKELEDQLKIWSNRLQRIKEIYRERDGKTDNKPTSSKPKQKKIFSSTNPKQKKLQNIRPMKKVNVSERFMSVSDKQKIFKNKEYSNTTKKTKKQRRKEKSNQLKLFNNFP